MATRVDLPDLSFSATMLMTMPQSTPLTYQARMSTNPTPVRIPKLKVRNRVDEITPVAQEQNVDLGSPTSVSSGAASPNSPSTPRSEQPPQTSQIYSPAPQRPNQNASVFALNDSQPKKKGIMGFLTVKEPSTAAFLKYAEQQQRAAALKGSASAPMQTVSKQKLPDYVPKVNKKWDGMPKVAHEPGHDQWKSSMDQGSFLGKMGKRSTSSATTSTTSRASRGAPSSISSSTRSKGSSGSGSGSGSRGSSNRTSTDRLESARADTFALSRTPSDNQARPQQQGPASRSNLSSTHNLDLDGYRTRTNTNSSPSTQLPEFADYSGYLPPAIEPGQQLRRNSSTETLKAPIEPVPSAELDTTQPQTPLSSDGTTSGDTTKNPTDVHPALRPKPVAAVGSDIAPPPPLQKSEFRPHTPDDIFPNSPHANTDSSSFESVNSQQPATLNGSQWPLPVSTAGTSASADRPSPPLPIRSPARQFDTHQRRPSQSSTVVPQFSTSPALPHSPSSPPQSPSRAGSASPRSFSRPFSLGPITPPSPQEPFHNPSPSQTPTPPSGSVAGPAIRPSQFRGHAFNTGVGLRPPASAIGRPLTKDSKLTPIIEADTASVLSVPLSMHLEDEAINRESHVLGDHALPGQRDPFPSRVHSGDSDPDDEDSSDDGTATEPDPDADHDDNDPDRLSFDDAASVRSELSISWYRSPKERLGLGGLIRHDKAGVPWPLEQEEDLDYVAGSGASSAEMERSAAAAAERKRKSFFGGFGKK